MLDFIAKVSNRIGTSEDTARKATGAVLQFVQDHANPKDAKAVLDALPGAPQLLRSAPEVADGGPAPVAGQLANRLAAKTGGVGTAVGLAAALTSSGLAANQFGTFVTAFVDFVRAKAGGDLVQRILVETPELQRLARS